VNAGAHSKWTTLVLTWSGAELLSCLFCEETSVSCVCWKKVLCEGERSFEAQMMLFFESPQDNVSLKDVCRSRCRTCHVCRTYHVCRSRCVALAMLCAQWHSQCCAGFDPRANVLQLPKSRTTSMLHWADPRLQRSYLIPPSCVCRTIVGILVPEFSACTVVEHARHETLLCLFVCAFTHVFT